MALRLPAVRSCVVVFAAIALLVTVAACGADTVRGALAAAERGGSSAKRSARIASDVVTRRVWSDDRSIDLLGDPSPDGTLLSFVDWDSGDLALRNLSAGTSTRLTGKRSWASNDFAESSTFSRDGKQIAYGWYNDSLGAYELRVMDLADRKPRVLLSDWKQARWIQPFDWTPDGKWVLTMLARPVPTSHQGTPVFWQGATSLSLVSTSGDSQIRALEGVFPYEAAISPDGQWIAYDAPSGPLNTHPRDVHVIRRDGSQKRRAMAGPSNDRLLGWLDDPNALLLLSDRSGSRAVWLQRMRGGVPDGNAELVRGDLGFIESIGVSGNRFFYFVVLEPQRVVTATVDLAAARVLSPATHVSPPMVRSNTPAWSADGRFLAYLVRSQLTERSAILVIRGPDGSQLREMPLPLDNVTFLRWAPDGNAVIVNGRDAKSRIGVFRVELRSGEATLLLAAGSGTTAYIRQPYLAGDNRTLYFIRNDPTGSFPVIYARDLVTGRERVVFSRRGDGVNSIEPSPDGTQLAFSGFVGELKTQALRVVSSAGGTPRELARLAPDQFVPGFGGHAWSPDGRYVTYVVAPNTPQTRGQEAWVAALDGSGPRKLFEDVRIAHMRLHSDGRRLVYTSGGNRGEVWVMEGFAH